MLVFFNNYCSIMIHIFRISILFAIFFRAIFIQAQTSEIVVNVTQAFSPQAMLLYFNGTDYVAIDSSNQLTQGSYRFTAEKGYAKGFYRVDVGKSIKLKLIVSGEPKIDVNTVVYAPNDSLKSSLSVGNNMYWLFQNRKKRVDQQLWLTHSLMDFYPDTSAFRKQLAAEVISVNSSLFAFADSLINLNPNALASRFIRIEQKPVIPSSVNPLSEEVIRTWWGQIDLFDTLTLKTPLFKNRLWDYMDHFYSDDLDKESQELTFTKGIHLLLSLDMHLEVAKAIRQLLLDGFKDSDYLEIIDYLNYTQFGKLNPLKRGSITPKSSDSPRVRVGEKAFDFPLRIANMRSMYLSEVNATYKLILFWSSWCPHCLDAMPRIKKIYADYKQKGFEVIAISLDDEPFMWKRNINELGLDWLNHNEPYTPDNAVINMYDAHETPQMFLLSKDLEILSKPSTVRQLEVKLRRLTR